MKNQDMYVESQEVASIVQLQMSHLLVGLSHGCHLCLPCRQITIWYMAQTCSACRLSRWLQSDSAKGAKLAGQIGGEAHGKILYSNHMMQDKLQWR